MTKRCALVLLLLLADATLAQAAPRHLRIWWDVRSGDACAWVGTVSDTTFVLPAGNPCANPGLTPGFVMVTRGLVRKGDYVTVYAYNYNAVSYKPLAPVVTVLKPEEPVVITLVEAILKVTGRMKAFMYGAPESGSKCVGEFDAAGCLNEIRGAVGRIRSAGDKWDRELKDDARELAKLRADIPANLRTGATAPPEFGIRNLKETACKFFVDEETKNPLGEFCANKDGWIQEIGTAFGNAVSRIRAFDAAYAPGRMSPAQLVERDRYQQAIDDYLEYVTGADKGIRSELAAGVVQLAEDLAAIRGYRNALDPNKAGLYSVEIPRQGPVGSLNRLIFALPMRVVGAPEGAPAQVTRSFSFEVAADRPIVLPAAGIMWLPSNFDFVDLAIEQVPNGPPVTARRLTTTPSDQFSTVTALLTTNFRLHAHESVPYVAIGTTADKNIFKSAMFGAAWFVPRWRSLFTIGLLRGKGLTEEDLQPIIASYSGPNGFVSDNISLSQIPAPKAWHNTFVIGWTFTPF